MSLLKPKIYSALAGGGALAALVGTRIYPVDAPQDVATPFVTYQRVGGNRETDLGGVTNLEVPTFQVLGWSDDPDVAESLVEPIIAAMFAASGFSVGSVTYAPDLFEDSLYGAGVDFRISHDLT